MYNLIPDATLLGSVLLAGVLDSLIPIAQIIPWPLTLVGWLIAIGGFIVAVRTLVMLRMRGGSTDVTGTSSGFVTDGPYAFSRNPFYVMYVVVALGVALGFGSVIAFVAPVLCFAVLNFIVIPIEERSLQDLFGKKYTAYRRKVRRWL